jgi:hypothetical protein
MNIDKKNFEIWYNFDKRVLEKENKLFVINNIYENEFLKLKLYIICSNENIINDINDNYYIIPSIIPIKAFIDDNEKIFQCNYIFDKIKKINNGYLLEFIINANLDYELKGVIYNCYLCIKNKNTLELYSNYLINETYKFKYNLHFKIKII